MKNQAPDVQPTFGNLGEFAEGVRSAVASHKVTERNRAMCIRSIGTSLFATALDLVVGAVTLAILAAGTYMQRAER